MTTHLFGSSWYRTHVKIYSGGGSVLVIRC